MKKLSILIAAILCLISCNHKSSSPFPQSFTSGKWHIVDYKKGSNEKRNRYSGFNFTFSRDHHIIASGNNHTYTGDWSVLESDLTDDAPPTDIAFNIRFTSKTGLSGINGEWTIVKKTDNFLSLIHMDTENTDFLIFEK
ncbi:hypothetical protein D3C87_526450 [compost metagenome]